MQSGKQLCRLGRETPKGKEVVNVVPETAKELWVICFSLAWGHNGRTIFLFYFILTLEEEKEKHRCETDTSIGCLPHAPDLAGDQT